MTKLLRIDAEAVETETHVRIISVMHGHRRPAYWRRRIESQKAPRFRGAFGFCVFRWSHGGSNPRPPECDSGALPAEL
jgi:hypothetical protein